MLIPYSKLDTVRTLFTNLSIKDTNYGVFEEFYISRPHLANLVIAELHKDVPGFAILFFKIYIKDNNLYNDRTLIDNIPDLISTLDNYSVILKQYEQILEIKKIKKDFL
jgi:hypothetical protein